MGFAVFFGFGPELWPISINFGWNKKVTNVKLGKCQYWSVCAERIDTTMQLFLRYWHSWAAQPPPESFCIDNRCSHCNRQSQTNLSSSKFFHKKADTKAQVVVHHASKLRILTGDQKCCPIDMQKNGWFKQCLNLIENNAYFLWTFKSQIFVRRCTYNLCT